MGITSVLPRATRGLQDAGCYRAPAGRTSAGGSRPDLCLDANEGPAPDPAWFVDDPADARRYQTPAALEADLARRFGLVPEAVLVTAGADEALLRAALAYVAPGDAVVLQTPAFEMLTRYAQLAGGRLVPVPEDPGRFPTREVLRAMGRERDTLALTALVAPSNPTGAAATATDVRRVARANPRAVLLCDLAYAEYADEDLTPAALGEPNSLVVRTFSKAWGLAGARVGYVLGDPRLVAPLRAAGSPYPVARASIGAARRALAEGEARMRAGVEVVRAERERLAEVLAGLGASPLPSQANFVLARVPDAVALRARLARDGIAVRAFEGTAGLEGSVRITCPGDADGMRRLEAALTKALGRRRRA